MKIKNLEQVCDLSSKYKLVEKEIYYRAESEKVNKGKTYEFSGVYQKTYTRNERINRLVRAVLWTLGTLFLGLLSPKIRGNWVKAITGKKMIAAYVQKELEVTQRNLGQSIPFTSLRSVLPNNGGADRTQYLIPCLNQVGASLFGQEKCGWHALKNAFCALAFARNLPVARSRQGTIFTDRQIYTVFDRFIDNILKQNVSGPHDISSAEIKELIGAMARGGKLPFEGLQELAVDPSAYSIVTIAQATGELGLSDPLMLNTFANMKELANKQGPFHHAFIVGVEDDAQHWITVIYEKDENQRVRLYGLDSWNDQYQYIFRAIPSIQGTIETIDAQLDNIYDQAANAAGFERKRNWFTDRSLTTDYTTNPANVAALNNGHIIGGKNLEAAVEFMSRVGWLEPDSRAERQQEIETIQFLLGYYRAKKITNRHLIAANRILTEKGL